MVNARLAIPIVPKTRSARPSYIIALASGLSESLSSMADNDCQSEIFLLNCHIDLESFFRIDIVVSVFGVVGDQPGERLIGNWQNITS